MGPQTESRQVDTGDGAGEAWEVSRARCGPQTLLIYWSQVFISRLSAGIQDRSQRNSRKWAGGLSRPACCSVRAPEDSTGPAVLHPCSYPPSGRPVLQGAGASHPSRPPGWTDDPQSP